MESSAQPAPSVTALSARVFWICFILIALTGAALRMIDAASFRQTGFDELLYRRYVNLMDGGTQRVDAFQRDMSLKPFEFDVKGTGAAAMPSLTSLFIRTQKLPDSLCELPPTRFLYIYTSWCWKTVRFGAEPPLPQQELMRELRKPNTGPDYSRDADRRDPALRALHEVAFGFSVLLMLASGLFAWRLLGPGAGLGVMALVACDPVLLHLSQHAMVDGFFAFWAMMCLWTTWENLRSPNKTGWLVAHGACLALMVMTKENAFFVYCALSVVVLANHWLRFGTVTPRFLVASIGGPLAGVLVLVMLAGGFEEFISVYSTLVAKAQKLPYAQMTGDGPWYRYLIDLMTISPIVLCLALGALFTVAPRRREVAFVAVFVAAGYLIMCNVKYGMNLRYTSIWELPLRLAAFAMLWEMCARLGRRQWLAMTAAVAALCAYDFRQYAIFATDWDAPFHEEAPRDKRAPLYEMVPSDMLRSIRVIKDEPDTK